MRIDLPRCVGRVIFWITFVFVFGSWLGVFQRLLGMHVTLDTLQTRHMKIWKHWKWTWLHSLKIEDIRRNLTRLIWADKLQPKVYSLPTQCVACIWANDALACYQFLSPADRTVNQNLDLGPARAGPNKILSIRHALRRKPLLHRRLWQARCASR